MNEIKDICLNDDGSTSLSFQKLSGSGYLIRNLESGREYALTDITKVDEAIENLALDMKSGIQNALKKREVVAVNLAIVMDQSVNHALAKSAEQTHQQQEEPVKVEARMKIERYSENETQRSAKFSFDRGPKKSKDKEYDVSESEKFAKVSTDKEEYEDNPNNSEEKPGFEMIEDKPDIDSKISQHRSSYKPRKGSSPDTEDDEDETGND